MPTQMPSFVGFAATRTDPATTRERSQRSSSAAGGPGDLASIGAVAAPVLVVLAERDEFMPGADELVRELRARVRTLDCSHAAAARDPRFVELALSFIREHPLVNEH
jgi:hypothetical protein